MKISRGERVRPQKVCINGPEGVGKTTLAADLIKPLFVDAEGGTDHMDVDRVEVQSMKDIDEVFSFLCEEKNPYKTLVLDTIDWVEGKMIKELCAEHNTDSIVKVEGGYGKGFEILGERMLAFLEKLDRVRQKAGVHIVLLAHTKVQKFEDPQLAASYDRYQLKMEKKTSALVKEWVDALFFLNYNTKLADMKGGMTDKKRGVQGKERILYTSRTAAFDAKNRHGLPDEITVPEEHPASEMLDSVFYSSGSDIIDKARGDFAEEQEVKSLASRRDEEDGADEIPGLSESGTDKPDPLKDLIKRAGGIDAVNAFCEANNAKWDESMQKKALLKPDRFVEAVRG